MPRMIDYGSRQAFLQEAAFDIVRDQGVAALTRPAVARMLGTSVQTVGRCIDPAVPLVLLAAREADQRRRGRRWGIAPGVTPSRDLAFSLLPETTSHQDEERVWAQLRLWAAAAAVRPADSEPTLAQRFQLAERGWSADEQDPSHERGDLGSITPAQESARHRVAELVAAHDADLEATCTAVTGAALPDGVVAGRVEEARAMGTARILVACVRGLIHEMCEGRLQLAEARTVLAALLAAIGPTATDSHDSASHRVAE